MTGINAKIDCNYEGLCAMPSTNILRVELIVHILISYDRK